MSIPSNKYDIEIECGADFALSFVIRDDGGSLVNLADAVITAQLREYAEAQDYLEFTAVHNSAGGKITLTMAHEDTANISYTEGVYDVFVTLDGTTEKVVYGDVTVYPNVTKPVEGEIMYLLSFNTEEDLPAVGMMRRVYFCHASSFMYRWNGTAYVGMNMNTYWDDIPDKPETFPPSEHDHDDRYYTEGEVDTALAGKEDIANLKALAYKDKADFYDDIANLPSGYPPSPHNHDDRYYTEGETDTLLSGKSDTDHTHDDRYYTEGEVDTLLSAKADTDDLGALATKDTVDYDTDIDNLPTLGALAEKDAVDWDTDIDDIPEDFPPSAHTHTMSDVTDLPTFGDLAEKDTVDWDTDIDDIPSTFPPESHTHDDRYYTETEIDTALSGKSDTSHTHDDRYYTETDTDSLLSEKADIIHSSASGALVHITDAGAYPVDALSVGIEPVQDLHGYDAPWPAGGGKNKLPVTLTLLKERNTAGTWSNNVYTYNSITYTISTNAEDYVTKIVVNGTANGSSNLVLTKTEKHNDWLGLICNGCPSGGSGTTYYISGWNTTDNASIGVVDSGSGMTIPTNLEDKNFRLYISIGNGTSVSNKEFYPMIRLSSVTDATYAPYSNVCPISGHTEANIYHEVEYDADADPKITIDLGGTRYGAQLNVLTGEMTVTMVHLTLNSDSYVKNWGYGAPSNILPLINAPGAQRGYAKIKVNALKDVYSYFEFMNNNGVPVIASAQLNEIPFSPEGHMYATTEDAVTAGKAFVNAMISAGTPLEVCYTLATPLTVQLSPATLSLLLGENNIWSDTGSTAVGYRADTKLYIDSKLASAVAELQALILENS